MRANEVKPVEGVLSTGRSQLASPIARVDDGSIVVGAIVRSSVPPSDKSVTVNDHRGLTITGGLVGRDKVLHGHSVTRCSSRVLTWAAAVPARPR